MGYPHESKYKREDNWGEYKNCFSDYHGGKDAKRPKHFCDKVTMASTLSVDGPTTLASTLTVGGDAYFAQDATVAGLLTCGEICVLGLDPAEALDFADFFGCEGSMAAPDPFVQRLAGPVDIVQGRRGPGDMGVERKLVVGGSAFDSEDDDEGDSPASFAVDEDGAVVLPAPDPGGSGSGGGGTGGGGGGSGSGGGLDGESPNAALLVKGGGIVRGSLRVGGAGLLEEIGAATEDDDEQGKKAALSVTGSAGISESLAVGGLITCAELKVGGKSFNPSSIQVVTNVTTSGQGDSLRVNVTYGTLNVWTY